MISGMEFLESSRNTPQHYEIFLQWDEYLRTCYYEYHTLTSLSMGVLAVSPVDRLARHWRYLPEGNPELTGDGHPDCCQAGVASVLLKRMSDDRTSKVTFVPATGVLSQMSESHRDPAFPVSYTCEARVPDGIYPEEPAINVRPAPAPTFKGRSATAVSLQLLLEMSYLQNEGFEVPLNA